MNTKTYLIILCICISLSTVFLSGCYSRGTRSLLALELALKNRGYNGFYFKSGDGPEKLILKPFNINEILLYIDNEISALVFNFYTEEHAQQESKDMSEGLSTVFAFIQKTAGKPMDIEKMKENTLINHTALLMYQPLTEKPQDEFVTMFRKYTAPLDAGGED